MFRTICGESTLGNVVIATSMWGGDSQDISEARNRELRNRFFKQALDGGAKMARHHDTIESTHGIVRMVLGNSPAALQIQRELVDQQKDIADTTAGKAIIVELNEQIKRHQTELREVLEEIEQALEEKDEETRRELEEEKRKLQERVMEIANDEKGMSADYAAEKERVEARLKEMVWGAQKREGDEASHVRSLRDEAIVADRASSESKQQTMRPQDLAGIPTAISPNESAHRDTPQRTGETRFPPRRQQPFPPLPPYTPSPQITHPYVRVPFRIATHDS